MTSGVLDTWKVPCTKSLASAVAGYRIASGREVLLVVDTTFAPGSQVMAQYAKEAPDLPIIAFISLSKSVSRGRTTGGALVANHVSLARDVRARAAAMGAALDTIAQPDQLRCLVDNHVGVEGRCAYASAEIQS